MILSRSKINFHETFQPELPYLAKIIDLASHNFSGSKLEISELSGIPTGKQKGKVEPHIKYASFMGLVDCTVSKGIYSLSLSPLGTEVFIQDKFLHEYLTHWLCHYGLSRPDLGAPQWYYIVHKGHSGFYKNNSSDYHLNKANALFGTNVNFAEMFGVVKRCYSEGFLSDINYLKWDDRAKFIEHSENPELLFVYAYVILDCWKRLFPKKSEITLTELIEQIEIGKIFNVSDPEIDSILDNLEFEGVLKLNRQLYPPTIVCTSNLDIIIPKLYNRLL